MTCICESLLVGMKVRYTWTLNYSNLTVRPVLYGYIMEKYPQEGLSRVEFVVGASFIGCRAPGWGSRLACEDLEIVG